MTTTSPPTSWASACTKAKAFLSTVARPCAPSAASSFPHILNSNCHITHAIDDIGFKSIEDLWLRLQGAEQHQSRYSARRDFRAAGTERRRQDHADQHHLRDRQS